MYIAHAPISFLANEFIQRKKLSKLKVFERVLVGLFALLCGILPDFDFFALMAVGYPSFIHHSLLSHVPLFYIALWGILRGVYWLLSKYCFNEETKKFLRSDFVYVLIDTFLIATLFHLLMDLFAEDIMLLYPFTNQYFTLFKYTFEPNLFAGYFFSIPFGVELGFCILFLIYICKVLFKKTKLTESIYIGLLAISLIFLGYTVFVHLNTYNKSFLLNSNGAPANDVDQDMIIDGQDMDVNNDGKDNIQDVSEEDLVKGVQDILDSKKWAVYDQEGDILKEVKYKSGAFTSFRLISQAYWNIHSPIAPVLKDQALKDGDVRGYSYDFNQLYEFYKYFEKQGTLKPLNTDRGMLFGEGRFFFVLDNDGDVINVGITIKDNKVGIVLPGDENMKFHTMSEVVDMYKDTQILITQ